MPRLTRPHFTMAESHKVPTVNRRITLALFTNVSNAAQLRGEASSGRIEAVLLDPTLVSAHPVHACTLYLALYHACNNLTNQVAQLSSIILNFCE